MQSMYGCIMVPQAYGLKTISSANHLEPTPSSISEKSGSEVGANAWKKLCGPSSTVFGAKNPDLAIIAALTPLCAAQPGCKRFVQEPSVKYSNIPEARLPAIPNAAVVCALSKPSVTELAAAAPSAPITPTGWKPAL